MFMPNRETNSALMAFQSSALHLKSFTPSKTSKTSEVAELELTHLEISLKIALHSPAVFLQFCKQLIIKCQAKQPETVSSFIAFSPGLTATLRIPTHPHSVLSHTLRSSLTAAYAAAAAVQKVVCLSAGSALPSITLVNSPSH